jgi:hypothetical protein
MKHSDRCILFDIYIHHTCTALQTLEQCGFNVLSLSSLRTLPLSLEGVI